MKSFQLFMLLAFVTMTTTYSRIKKNPDFEAFKRRFDDIEAFNSSCEKCQDITSADKCKQLLPDDKSCDDPGFNYLKIFCRRTCDSCTSCASEQNDSNILLAEKLDLDF